MRLLEDLATATSALVEVADSARSALEVLQDQESPLLEAPEFVRLAKAFRRLDGDVGRPR